MNNYNTVKDLQKKRRFKYGSFSLALSVAVIALVVVVNAIFSALAQKNMWYVDMTERNLYTPDKNSMTLLETFRGSEEFHIEFVFCMPEDKLIQNELCTMVNNLLKKYDEEFDFISVDYIDINQNPQVLDKYMLTSTQNPKTTSVIVTNGKNSIVYSINSFFVSSDETTESIYAFNGDYKITSAVLRLSGESPIAYFVKNHGENVGQTALKELFVDSGYDVRDIDLTKEELDPAAKVVVINNPKTDFWGAGELVNEIKKLDNLLDGSAGLMVFIDETANEMPNLEDFLAHWGVRFERQSIRDYENRLASDDGSTFVAQYVTEGIGAGLTSSIRNGDHPLKPIIKASRPITLLYDEELGKYFANNGATRLASRVLVTSKDAVASPLDEGGETAKGIMNVMTLTSQSRMKDNTQYNSFLLASGSTSFSEDIYVNGPTYANRDIIFNALKQFSKENAPMPIGVRAKVFSDDSLTLTAKEANTWTVVCTVLLPAIVSGVGIYVYARRRYL